MLKPQRSRYCVHLKSGISNLSQLSSIGSLSSGGRCGWSCIDNKSFFLHRLWKDVALVGGIWSCAYLLERNCSQFSCRFHWLSALHVHLIESAWFAERGQDQDALQSNRLRESSEYLHGIGVARVWNLNSLIDRQIWIDTTLLSKDDMGSVQRLPCVFWVQSLMRDLQIASRH